MLSKVIAHRGNLNGPGSVENDPKGIHEALFAGYDVEIDVWLENNQILLGHDSPTYEVDLKFIKQDRLWCHAKNVDALSYMLKNSIHCFWHQEDNYTITSKGYIWVYPGQKLVPGCVALFDSYLLDHLAIAYAICTDYPTSYNLGEQNEV